MDKFFAVVSKAVIFIPLAIVITALILKFNQTSKAIGTIVSSITPTPTVSSQKINLDLTGPYQCFYKDEENDIKAYIKNKRVLVNIITKDDTDKYFFDGDCFFADGVKKMCNLSSYVSLLGNSLVGNVEMLKPVAEQYLKTGVDIEEIIKTCKKQDFEESIFNRK
jgi:hypothetical protein